MRGQQGIHVKLMERRAVVADLTRRQPLQCTQHRFGIGAAVGLRQPDDDIGPCRGETVPLGQQRLG
jgi:hypothetical protein